ncbi:hypothetical protein GCM10027073_15190 [Streptomyces chlorus]
MADDTPEATHDDALIAPVGGGGPIAGTPSCRIHHNGYVLQGRLRIRMDDGAESEVGPGDVFVCTPGHDAWVVGEEQVVVYDFAGAMAQSYAKAAD